MLGLLWQVLCLGLHTCSARPDVPWVLFSPHTHTVLGPGCAQVPLGTLRALPFVVSRGEAEAAFWAYQRSNPFLVPAASFEKAGAPMWFWSA
jgi:hypothetical protein